MLGLLQQTDKKMTQNRRGQPPGFTANETAHVQQTNGFLTSNLILRQAEIERWSMLYRLTCRAFADP